MMYQQKEKNYRQAIMEQARDADQAKGKDADKAGPANWIPVQGAAEQTLQIQSLGKKIRQSREQGGITQTGLAEELSVTRQAVSNWERDKTLPDVYTLQKIAAYFGMTLDEFMEGTKRAEVVMPKMPGILAAATGLTIFLYLVAGGSTGRLSVGTAASMVVVGVFCQLFLHLYFSSAVKTGNFSALAGYSSKVEYNVEEVKKLLVQMDTHISCTSFGTVLLLGIGALFGSGQADHFLEILILAYSGELTTVLLLYNYRGLDRTMVRESDRKAARAGYVSSIWLVAAVFVFLGAVIVKCSVKSIQNNSAGAVGILGWMFLFLLVALGEFFYEQRRAKKQMEEAGSYQPGAAFWAGTAAVAAVTVLMFLF